MSGSPIATGPAPTPGPTAPAPKTLTCKYCDSCVDGVTVPKQVDPGCPAQTTECTEKACESKGSSILGWICLAIVIIIVILIVIAFLSAILGGGSTGSFFGGLFISQMLFGH